MLKRDLGLKLIFCLVTTLQFFASATVSSDDDDGRGERHRR